MVEENVILIIIEDSFLIIFSIFTLCCLVKNVPVLEKIKNQRKFVIDSYILLILIWQFGYIGLFFEYMPNTYKDNSLRWIYGVFMFFTPKSLGTCLIIFYKTKCGRKFMKKYLCCFKKK